MNEDFITDDVGILWYVPRGQKPVLAVPRSMISRVLSLVHSIHGHPGVARTTLLVRDRFGWPTLRRDVREYVLSCGCRRRKRSNSRKVWMLPARFLKPWEVLEMDIQDLHQVSAAGNRYLLVVVERASKFVFGYPLPSKSALEVSRKLLELMLTFGVPISLRSDAGGEFTATVVKHLCTWLHVSLDHGPADFARGQGAAERMGGWFQEILSILCQAWPLRWDQYVLPACWIQRVTPDPSLPGNPTPFSLLFGRAPRTPLDMITRSVDGTELRGGWDVFVADRHQSFIEVQNALKQRQADKDKQREVANAKVRRASAGTRVKVGDLVMVREADSSLGAQGTHPKLLHDHYTAPWVVTNVPRPGQTVEVTLNGRRVRKRLVSVASVKLFHTRNKELRHDFEDEFSHLAWESTVGLSEVSVAASPMYTLFDRRVVRKNARVWKWEYRGRHQDGCESEWVDEEEASNSFTPLQLDVFHAFWEVYHDDGRRPRPPEGPSKGERDALSRERALQRHPVGTEVRRAFADGLGRVREDTGLVYDFSAPYWRIRYPDGDWEELNDGEVVEARQKADNYNSTSSGSR